MDYFDLKKTRWEVLQTTYRGLGPWPRDIPPLLCYTMQIIHGHMYIFSGVCSDTVMGCNLLLDLDIQKRIWRHLSGNIIPTPNMPLLPGPRRGAASWEDKEKGKLNI